MAIGVVPSGANVILSGLTVALAQGSHTIVGTRSGVCGFRLSDDGGAAIHPAQEVYTWGSATALGAKGKIVAMVR